MNSCINHFSLQKPYDSYDAERRDATPSRAPLYSVYITSDSPNQIHCSPLLYHSINILYIFFLNIFFISDF